MTDVVLHTFDGVTQYVRNTVYDDDRYSMAEVRTYDLGTAPIRYAIDIGAHIGSWTCYVKYLWPDAEIHAYEPEADNFRVLRANVVDQVWTWNNPVGYGSQPVVVLHPSHTTCHRVMAKTDVPIGSSIEETCGYMTLEQVLYLTNNWPCVDVLKIDAEGAEVDVFTHCTDESLLSIHRIVGEFHDGYDFFMQGIGARLQKLGFAVTAETDPNAHSVFAAWQP